MDAATRNTRLKAHLHHLVLESSAPERLVRFYEQVMGYVPCCSANGEAELAAPGRRLIIRRGADKRLVHAAFSFDCEEELLAYRAHLEEGGVRTVPAVATRMKSAFSVEAPGGRTLVFGVAEGVEDERREGALAGRLQHVVFATPDIEPLTEFLMRLGFVVSDDVRKADGALSARFMRSDHEHHSLAVFAAGESRLDHHCYETGSWNDIKDWADHLAHHNVELSWGPGRHGPGGNLFLMFKDPDGNWLEISAELEKVESDRPTGQWRHEARTLNQWGVAHMRS